MLDLDVLLSSSLLGYKMYIYECVITGQFHYLIATYLGSLLKEILSGSSEEAANCTYIPYSSLFNHLN